MNKPQIYYLDADNKDIQTFEYFASETRQYDSDIKVVDYAAYEEVCLKFARCRAKEINGTFRTYDGIVPELEAKLAVVESKLEILRKYHGGDGTVSRETVMEALSEGVKK